MAKTEPSVDQWLREAKADPAAAQCGCPTSHVERNIRTIIQHAWKKNPRKVRELARCELTTYPTVSEFIELLALEAQKYLPPTA